MNKAIIHEIGNYLHQIISYCELIEHKLDSIDIVEYAKKIQKSAYTIDAMISDSVSKKEKVDKTKVDFSYVNEEQFVGMKVMIVDDIDENIEIMENIFATFSCEIRSAKNAEKAFEIYKSGFHPEFVCMDIVMPNTDGYETTKQLKALGSTAFFMVVSALKNRPKDNMSLFNYWLSKPFSMDDIIFALLKYESMQHIEIEKAYPVFSLDLSQEIKDELLEYANSGAYTSIKRLIKTLPESDSKEFLRVALEKMNLDSIIKSIVSPQFGAIINVNKK